MVHDELAAEAKALLEEQDWSEEEGEIGEDS
jgi:hypothetical protein